MGLAALASSGQQLCTVRCALPAGYHDRGICTHAQSACIAPQAHTAGGHTAGGHTAEEHGPRSTSLGAAWSDAPTRDMPRWDHRSIL